MKKTSKFLEPRSFAGLLATAGLLSTLAIAASPPGKTARLSASTKSRDSSGTTDAAFRQQIQPLFKKYCYSCHSGDTKSGGVAFDDLSADPSFQQHRGLFGKVLKNLRSGTMPPASMDQPTAAEKGIFEQWIKSHVY